MKSTLAIGAILCAAVACGSAPTPASTGPAPVASSDGPSSPTQRDLMVRTVGVVGESFRPQTGDAALRAFVPEIPADESGGECQLLRTGGSGATMVSAYYPARATSKTQVSLTFDSVGHLARYSERRGVPHFPVMKGLTQAQVDSALRAGEANTRSTTISLDYAVDRATAMNRGAGMPIAAVMGTVRAMESLPSLGPVSARLERVRKLCGV